MLQNSKTPDKWSALLSGIGLALTAGFSAALVVDGASVGSVNWFTSVLVYLSCNITFWAVQMVYHVVYREEREHVTWQEMLRRFDHATVFLLVAGHFVPALRAFGAPAGAFVETILWIAVAAGMILTMAWSGMPRWATPVAAFAVSIIGMVVLIVNIASIPLPGIFGFLGGVASLVIAGLVYAAKKPNPVPGKFTSHEVYHSLAILGVVLLFMLVLCSMSAMLTS